MLALERHDPRTIGRYRVLARIGAGGLAIVYFGRSASGRAVAIKAVHNEFATNRDYRDRFRREVAATRAVGGRYSPGVLDADPDVAIPWLAMEFLPSVTLREAVRQVGPLPAASVRTLGAGLAEALASIHRAGVAHLDLKPANILLTADGPRVIDFSIAVQLHSGLATLGGTPAGSSGYLSPEQSAGGWVSQASDVFALGATLAYASTGLPRPIEIADERLAAVIEGCLRIDPAARLTVPQLADLLAAREESSAAWLPTEVTTEITRRAGEARNPPVDEFPAGPPRAVGRRALLLGAGVLALGGGTAAVLASRPAEPGEAAPTTTTTAPTSTSDTPVATPEPRTLEFYVFGKTTVRSLTTTVNGDAVTVQNPKLPYRRVVEIPQSPQRSTWRIAYHHSAGDFNYRVIVDGTEYGTGGSSSNRDDVQPDPVDGTI